MRNFTDCKNSWQVPYLDFCRKSRCSNRKIAKSIHRLRNKEERFVTIIGEKNFQDISRGKLVQGIVRHVGIINKHKESTKDSSVLALKLSR